MPPSPLLPVTDYHRWRSRTVVVGQRSYDVAVKPGLIGQGRDEAAELLAAEVVVPEGGTVICLQSGNGLIGAVALANGATGVFLSDRNFVAAEATRRTLDANGGSNATVAHAQGAALFDHTLRADLVTVRIPTEKPALTQLLADAFALAQVGGRCCIAGATNEGIKSAASMLHDLFGNSTVLATRGGCRAVMAVKRRATPANADATPVVARDAFHAMDVVLRGEPTRLYSLPGVFSWEHLDEASALLAEQMQIAPGAAVLDLGCGSGPLGLTAARLSGTGRVCMVDVDAEAVRCATRAVEHAGLTQVDVRASDVASTVLDRQFDVVVCNPPFHVGKGTDLDVPAQFIRDAHTVLRAGGSLQLVANRTLPYEQIITDTFGTVRTVYDGPRFKILSARR